MGYVHTLAVYSPNILKPSRPCALNHRHARALRHPLLYIFTLYFGRTRIKYARDFARLANKLTNLRIYVYRIMMGSSSSDLWEPACKRQRREVSLCMCFGKRWHSFFLSSVGMFSQWFVIYLFGSRNVPLKCNNLSYGFDGLTFFACNCIVYTENPYNMWAEIECIITKILKSAQKCVFTMNCFREKVVIY